MSQKYIPSKFSQKSIKLTVRIKNKREKEFIKITK